MSSGQRLIPFGTFPMEDDDVEIMMLTPDEKGRGYVTAEKPDAVYGFKNAKITYPDLVVETSEGFTADEMAWLIQLLRDNMGLVAKAGREAKVYAYA